jgi:hypothetical protein
MKRALILACFALCLILLPSLFEGSQVTSTPNPRITDLFSGDEVKRAGLSKLSAEEIAALNASILRVFVQLNMQSDSRKDLSLTGGRRESDDLDFYDSLGKAVVYLDDEGDDNTFYLWDGKPVAYLDEDSLYGFNGKHLGWIKNGIIYDHSGNVEVALSRVFSTPVSVAPPKSFRQFKPFKAFKEFKPFKPFFTSTWSDTPAKSFFISGSS